MAIKTLKGSPAARPFAVPSKEFKRLGKRAKRVAIAKDVLAQLKTGRFTERRGLYFRFWKCGSNNHVDFHRSTEPAKEFINAPGVTCEVCAKGSLVLSAIRGINERTCHEIDENDQEIIGIFGAQMWDELECMFEGRNMVHRYIMSEAFKAKHDRYQWGKFFDKSYTWRAGLNSESYIRNDYTRDCEDLEALMKNIIKNKGKLLTQHGELLG